MMLRVKPLTGMLVVDLTRYLPGPFASRELLRHGARVVRLESPDGDPLRAIAPEWDAALNAGKESVVCDLKKEPELGRALCSRADVVLEGFRPGIVERLGIGPGDLADTAPALPPVQIADLGSGALAAIGEILAALLERERTGKGSRIEISMTHGAHRFAAHRLSGEPVPRLLTGGLACYRIYDTADGRHLTIAALEPKFFRRLCELLERPELVELHFEADAQERLATELAELIASRPLDAWLQLFEGEDVAAGPVATLAEAAADFGLEPPVGRPPRLGEHTEAWRRELED